MNYYNATSADYERLKNANTSLARAVQELSETRYSLTLAGVGTFGTESDWHSVLILRDRAQKIQLRLAKKLERAAKCVPATPLIASTLKRSVKKNVYGNIKGYEGGRRVEDFGTDHYAAVQWKHRLTDEEFMAKKEDLQKELNDLS